MGNCFQVHIFFFDGKRSFSIWALVEMSKLNGSLIKALYRMGFASPNGGPPYDMRYIVLDSIIWCMYVI